MNARARWISLGLLALLATLSPAFLLAEVGQWTSNGPDGGHVIAIAAHAANPSTVYLSTDQRVYQSADAGAHWTPAGLSGAFYLLLPTSASSVAYVTANATSSNDNSLYRTTDGGRSWVRVALPGQVVSLSVNRNDPMALYAVTWSGTVGIHRTTNGGDSWELLANPLALGRGISDVVADPGDPAVLYAAVINQGISSGVYVSSDRGATWTRTSLQTGTLSLLFDPSNSSRLFALTTSGLQVTTDRGVSWRRLGGFQEFLSHMAIDPTDSNRLYVISEGVVLRSSDGGETLMSVPDGNFGYAMALTVSAGGAVLVGSERGTHRSDDKGQSWIAANDGVRELVVPSIAIDPTDPAVVFAASPQGIYESDDGGASWSLPLAGIRSASIVRVDPSDRSTMYAAGRGVHKSTDRGGTWQDRSPLPLYDVVDRIADLLIDTDNPRRILVSTVNVYGSQNGVYRTENGADSWNQVIRIEDDYAAYYYPPTVTRIALAPSDGMTAYAAGVDWDHGDGFVYRSIDRGGAWSGPTTIDPLVTALTVDSCDARTVYAGTYAYPQGGLRRSDDGGETWREPHLPGVSVLALARDPRHSSSIFAGTSQGLFWSNDRGESWTRFEPVLAEPITSISIDASGHFVYAGTSRGVFQLERSFDACRDGPDRLCLIGSKYELTVTGRHPRTGAPITGHAIAEGDRFGYFSFPDVTGDPGFPEVFVKMADATEAGPPYGGAAWVFHSALTDLDYTLTVRETATGRVRTYVAADTAPLTCGSADTYAFIRDCGVRESAVSISTTRLAAAGGELSLLGGRFRATLRATDPRTGRVDDGAAIARADGFGYFSLPSFTGDASFPEVLVKMVDGRAQPGNSFWVFHTGLTDLEYTLTVTDAATGSVRSYTRAPSGATRLCGAADTLAFHDP
jgi:photosystem II stability/assembly factor-like uncharacterized protein